MGGPSKPRLASAANMSKRGLSARLYAPNQTLTMVNTPLPTTDFGLEKASPRLWRLSAERRPGNGCRRASPSPPAVEHYRRQQPRKQNRPSAFANGRSSRHRVYRTLRLRLNFHVMFGAGRRKAAASDADDAVP